MCACLAAAPWPSQGYVNVDVLVEQSPLWRQVASLRATAAALRGAADSHVVAPLAPVAPDAVSAPPGLEADIRGFEDASVTEKAHELQRQLLRESYLAQIAAARRRGLSAQAPALEVEMVAAGDRQRARWEQRQRVFAGAEALGRTNLRLDLTDRNATRRAEAKAELETLETLDRALSDAWQRDEAGTVARGLRARLAEISTQLARAADEQQRAADRVLERREDELADTNPWLGSVPDGELATSGPPLDLQLRLWRAGAGKLQAAANDRALQLRDSDRATAEALERDAARLATGLRERARAQVLAWLSVIGREQSVHLVTERAPNLPDLTTRVAQRVAELRDSEEPLPPVPAALNFDDPQVQP